MLDDLEVGVENAEAVIAAAIEYEAYTDDMPESNKDMIEAAHEVVGLALSSWLEDEVRGGPDADEEEKAAAEQIKTIFSLAGIRAKGDKITYAKPPSVEKANSILSDAGIDYVVSANGDTADNNDGDDDEAPFDIDDYIEGYEELTAATRIKKIKALDLDPEEEEDRNTLIAIAEWEESQDQPSSRVLDYLNELVPPEDEDEDDEEEVSSKDDDNDVAVASVYTEKDLKKLDKDELREIWDEWEMPDDDFPKRFTDKGKSRVIAALLEAQNTDNGDDESDSGDDDDAEPWEGYDELDEEQIQSALEEKLDDEDDPLDAEQVQYIIDWERGYDDQREELIGWLEGLLEELSPKKASKRGRSTAKDEVKEKAAPSTRKSRKSSSEDGFEADDGQIRDMLPKGLGRAFVESKLHEKHLREAGLTPPGDFEGEMPDLPDDIGNTDHEQLSNLMLAFQSAHGTSTWQSSMAYIEADIMEEIADYLENRVLLASEQSNDAKRKAEARTDPQVVFFRAKRSTAYHDYVRYRDLAKTIEGKIKVLSRVGGFKDDEDEASDRSAKPRGTAGAAKRRTRTRSK